MAGINSQGSRIYHSKAISTSGYARLEQVTNIAGPDGSAPLIDVSDLESVNKEYLPGLGDSGTLTVDCNFGGKTEQMDMKRMFDTSADAEAFALQIPTDSTKQQFHTFEFLAVVTKWSLKSSVNNKVDLSITLQVSGQVSPLGAQSTLG